MQCVQGGIRSARALQPNSAQTPLPPEALERRALLSALPGPGLVTAGITRGSTGAGLTYPTIVDHVGGGAMVRPGGTILAPLDVPAIAAAAAPAAQPFNIVLNKGPGLQDDPQAAAAFEQAAAFLESRFSDPVTITIDADVEPLGGNTLGRASSVIYGPSFDVIRNRMVADANLQDEAFVSQLPSAASFLSNIPNGFTLSGMSATRANLLALGFSPVQYPGVRSAYGGAPIDATITFSSQFPFDYDRSNGIQAGKSDFVGVAIHEITHALGFNSAVDDVDSAYPSGGRVAPMPLDLFRFEPGAGGTDFAGGTRVLSPGTLVPNQVFYDGGIFNPTGITLIPGLRSGDLPLSTGSFNGDDNQASHWKDDELIGRTHTIGIMDPSATVGTQQVWTANDERAMSLIGWDAAPAALQGRIYGNVYQDENGNGVYEPAGGDFPMGNVIVYHDANNNGQFDDGIVTRFASGSDVPVGIPDPGIVESQIVIDDLPGTVRDVNVTLSIEHSYTPDLEVTLISPTGRSVMLFSGVGSGLFPENFTLTTLDDESVDHIEFGDPPFFGSYIPMDLLNAMDGETMNGTWTLRVEDLDSVDEGTLLDWNLTFDTGNAEPNILSQDDGTYSLSGLSAGTYRLRQVLFDGFTQTQPAANGAYVVTLAEGQEVAGKNFGSTNGVPAATVVGRQIFYNHSKFDGGSANANAQDDGAIAADKQVLLPGQAASFANYTSYSRGINGLMIDVSGLPTGTTPTAADFDFKVGNDEFPAGWAAPAVAPAVAVRRGAGAGGSDRITLTWPDGSIVGRWLQVTINPTANTALATPDVFYVGNLPGETGNATAAAAVNALDVMAVRSNLNRVGRAIDDRQDFNRDGRINASDLAAARGGSGNSLHLLSTTATSAAAPAAPQGDLFSVVPVARRRSAYRPGSLLDGLAPVL